jgi:hypothetical protein
MLNFISEILYFVYRYTFKVLVHGEVTFLNIAKKFLRMRSGLRTRPRSYVLLYELPIFPMQLKSF